MSGALGNLLIKLTADTGEATGDIGKAAHQIERDMQTMATKAAAAGALIGNVMGDVVVALSRAAKEAVMFGDKMQKMSQRTGMAVGRLSEIAFASDLADVSIGQVSAGLAQFNKALVDADKDGGKAQQMFEALGVSVTEGPQVAFEQMAVAINSLPDGETKAAAMRAAFGRAGDAMIPMLAGLDDATEKARRLGLTLSEDMARDSEKFNDAMTTLGAGLSALVRNSLSGTVSVLAEMSNQLVNAAAKGQFFTGVLYEMGRASAAVLGGIAALFGDEKVVDEAAKSFASMTIKPAGGAAPAPAPTVDQAKLRAALSRSGASGRVGKGGRSVRDDNLAGRQSQEWMASQSSRMAKERAKEMAEAADANNQASDALEERARLEFKWGQEFTNMTLAEIKEWEKRKFAAIDAMEQISEERTRMVNGFDESGKKIGESAKKNSEWARDLGLSFTSAFEDAVIAGKKFSDVLRSLAQDIAKMMLRKAVTEPLASAAGSFLEGIFRAEGGPVTAGSSYIVGEQGPEMFVPSVSGSIVPNHAMGGGGVTVVQNINIDSRSDQASIMQAMAMSAERAKNDIMASLNRGGEFARATGRA
jgi:hypothetical protein